MFIDMFVKKLCWRLPGWFSVILTLSWQHCTSDQMMKIVCINNEVKYVDKMLENIYFQSLEDPQLYNFLNNIVQMKIFLSLNAREIEALHVTTRLCESWQNFT